MKTALLLLVVLLSPALAYAQEAEAPEGAVITSAHVTGFDLARLSPGLQEEIAKLAGGEVNREQLRLIASRIEAEQPRVLAAVRAVQDPDGDVRVVFVVARARSDRDRENINARYVIEQVEIRGFREDDLDQTLRSDLHGLVGRRLDSDEAERAETSLKQAVPDYEVRRSIQRGNQSGQIRLVFVLNKMESARWLHFEPSKWNAVYHSDQGWGGYFDFMMSARDFRLTPIVAWDHGDDLIEEYSGFGLRFETRNLGSERLGASLEWSTFDQTWRDATVAALELNPLLPSLYETRSTVTPRIRFAVTQRVNVSAGVSIAELEPFSDAGDSESANAFIASVGYNEHWQQYSDTRHDVVAAFSVRAGTDALESDYVYQRYFGHGVYGYRMRKHNVLLSVMGGAISDDAPLFERFSLGDSRTLRGWDKYDIAPAGGDRMFHSTVEYRYGGLGFFLDSGSVWDRDADNKVRFGTGINFQPGPVFMTVGFPLNTDDIRAVFTMGIRFSGLGFQRF